MKTISKIVGLPASKLKVYRKVIFEGDLLDTQLMSMYPKKNLWSYNMTHEDVIVCDHKDNQSVVKDVRVKFCWVFCQLMNSHGSTDQLDSL